MRTPALFIFLLFVPLWLLSLALVSRVSGWHALAQRFRAMEPFRGRKRYLRTCWLRASVHYRGCVTVGVDTAGLSLSLLPPFNFQHPPLFVPWAELTADPAPTGMLVKRRCFHVLSEPEVPICLPERLVAQLLPEMPPSVLRPPSPF